MSEYVESTTLLERRQDLRDQIFLAGPDHFDMGWWGQKNGVKYDLYQVDRALGDINQCGTAACLAGHAQVLAKLEAHFDLDMHIADAFGLTVNVFSTMNWDNILLSSGQSLAHRWVANGGAAYSYTNQAIYLSLESFEVHDVPDLICMPTEPAVKQKLEWMTILDYLDDLIKQEINQ
jgi:hypothetical protein